MPVRATLERAAVERGVGERVLVNTLLRAALGDAPAVPKRGLYRTKSVDLGRCLVGDVVDVAAALAAAERDPLE
jgi:hypothetical protein